MANQLTDMDIDEISLVDDGANPGAKVEIWKAKGGKPAATHAEPDADDQGGKPDDDEDDADGFGFKGDAKKNCGVKKQQEIEMTLEELAKSLEAAEAKLDELEKANGDAVARAAELEGVVKAKDAEIAGLKSDIAKAKPADTEDEILKALPEAARELVLKAKKAEAEATAALAKAKDAQDTADAIAKAKALNFGKPEDVGPLLMRVAKGMTTTADAEKLEQLLKSAGEVASKSPLFKSIGSGQAVEGDPEELLKAKADEVKKANPNLTAAAAYAQALDQHPELYAASIAKRRAAA